ncbi:MAG: prefoldin subunit alpha [Candidatus Thorarchaeota archaeon]
MENSQEANKLLYDFRNLKEQRDMFANQLEIINVSLNNLMNTKTTIENLKNVKEGEEILVPVGGLINLQATIKNPSRILFYISQDVVIEKDLDSATEFIDKIIGQHNEQQQYLRTQIQNLDLNLQNMSRSFQRSDFQQK